ncbi:LamG-like jellyroll fold domain-containing protein [Winogradskyella schleiferi]|uniref:LamG-like jellyroll fold domain-containing protein n=1 Tax=Winogradskyella schleiferi TaxID=2686078 RepID=UPI0015BCACB7|nr:LamG-like jellyroll fold domain-containing protein [Winogradskyella schleiferi]
MQNFTKFILVAVVLFFPLIMLSQTSISLNGSSDYITIQNETSLDISGNFTIETWIKPNDISGEKTILIKGNNGQCGNYGLFIKDNNLAFVSAGDCNWAVSRGPNSVLQIGIWQHVAAVSNGNNVNLYINGTLTDTLVRNAAAGAVNNDDLWIGRSVFSTTNFFFNGFIDEVRIWDDIRTLPELQNNMNTELSGVEPNLVAYYKLNDIETGCDVEDCSINENHGVRININDNTNPPQYNSEQPSNLINVACGVSFNDCITFQGEFQLFVDDVMLNFQQGNAVSFLNDEIQVTETIQTLQFYYANRIQIVDEYYDFLESLCITYPEFFQVTYTFDDVLYKYLGSFREQIHMYLRDYLREYPEKEPQFLAALDLNNPNASSYYNIWSDYGILVVDNHSLSPLQLSVIANILATIPEGITNLEVILFREFYTDNFENAIYITQFVSAINSFGNPIGTWTENGFPEGSGSYISDQFSIALSHEICHTIDSDYILNNSRLLNWKTALLTEAGTSYNEFLRTRVLDIGGNDFFQVYPQEFFASLANMYFSNSFLTLEVAIERFNNGYEQPINQFLLMLDVLSSESTNSQFYTIDANSNIAITYHTIERNDDGFITELYITDECSLQFAYDANNFVESMIVPDLSSNICNPSLHISDTPSIKSLSIYPNPTNGILNLKSNTENEDFNIKIFDVYGKIINEFEAVKEVNIKQLHSGIYLMELESNLNRTKATRRIIKI